jgi:hypothetical protein
MVGASSKRYLIDSLKKRYLIDAINSWDYFLFHISMAWRGHYSLGTPFVHACDLRYILFLWLSAFHVITSHLGRKMGDGYDILVRSSLNNLIIFIGMIGKGHSFQDTLHNNPLTICGARDITSLLFWLRRVLAEVYYKRGIFFCLMCVFG